MPWNCAACTFTNHCEVCEKPHRTYAQIVTGTRVTASVDDSEFLKAADILSSLSQVDQPVYNYSFFSLCVVSLWVFHILLMTADVRTRV